ncbi:MAG: Tat pathway signal protein, partial [Bacteroidales bacterium]|nr:Tat pathway signal protein [Bacteroidales bacterium]
PDVFFRKMPKSVLQSNWYYGTDFGSDPHEYVQYYEALDKRGYDQIPTGSNHSDPDNMGMTVEYCRNVIDPGRLYGFMTAPWRPTLAPCFERHKQAIDQMVSALNNH